MTVRSANTNRSDGIIAMPALTFDRELGLGDVAPVELDRAAEHRCDAQDRADGGALAAAVVAEHAEDLALADVQVDVEHHLLAAVPGLQLGRR